MTGPTVPQALRTLAHRRAFTAADTAWAHGVAAQLRVGSPLSHDQERRAHRMLGAYRRQLSEAGIDYAEIPVPDGSTDFPPPSAAPAPAPAPLTPGPATRSKAWVDAAGRLWVKNPYELRTVVAAIPGATWKKGVLAWELPATPSAAGNVAAALQPTGLVTNPSFDELLEQHRRGVRARAFRITPEADLPPIPGRTAGWEHQLRAFHFTRELEASCLDMGMGTGKSRVIVGLMEDWRPASVLIVCPERVVGVWPKQIRLHGLTEHHVIDPRRQKRTGEWELLPVAKRVELYDHAMHDCSCGLPHVLLTNFAAAGVPAFSAWSLRQRFDVVAFDESHRLRSHSGVWSEWAEKMRKRSDRRIAGTGTLQAQTPEDVFGQFRALDPGIFGTSFTAFRRRYSITRPHLTTEIYVGPNPQMEEEFAAKVASITFTAGEEVLDLPAELDLPRATCRLSPSTMRAYRDLEDEMVAAFAALRADAVSVDDPDADVVSVDNPLVKRLRLLQVASGTVVADDGAVLHVDDAKEKLLVDLLSDLPEREPVVVFGKFHPDLDAIARAATQLKRPYAELSGRRSDALAQDATLAEGVVIAGVQIQAGGTGVDFTRAAYGIYFSPGDSLGDYLQSRKRLARPGQTRSVRFRHLCVEGTVEEDVYDGLEARADVVDRIKDRIRRLQGGRR